MKKMRNGRRGFTLLEIVIVVAIIIILSAGAFLGVAATVNHASDMQERLEANNGDNFEVYARNQVASYGKNMVYWDPIPNYTPENQAKKMKEQMLAEGWTDGEISFEYQTDGWHIVTEWDPTLPEHRGFQTPEDYKLWLSNYNYYIGLGYTAAEIEAGCKKGSTDIKPVYDSNQHGGVSEEQYLKDKQGGGTTPDKPNPDKPNPDKPNTDPVNPDPEKPNPDKPSTGGSTMSLHAPSQYNLQAQNNKFSGNGNPVKSITVTISDGATFTNVSNTDNGGKYKFKMSDDKKSFTITFDDSLGWASPNTDIVVGDIQWSGDMNVELTYDFTYT